ncbi:hypothetical protein AAFF_G00091770 [Aldrovandia affinis]|uniref:Wiskott-Aldrich syndrome protein family member n=1 Tax=Aldrovandia affinis TaxID=143900 RepID=A0AAD7T4B5_9TELE|nr:hypothetical protein AAFF_G00091770 [Aldrovandia affinis]
MPLVKRSIEPCHLCRGGLPEGMGSELECVTNNTLSTIIRQLSNLSKHAEDIFGELFNEANTFYLRANSLQDRIDRLATKVTQLDSTVEEVSLQDINMRKAFKSNAMQDQQVVTQSSIPNPVVEMYNTSDKPPSLNILSPYRDDQKEGLKFYTNPSYFFDLWREKMLQDTEQKRKEKRRQKEQRRSVGGTLQREVKKVRKARNRRQEWNMMAFDKELRPDGRHSHSLHRKGSSEGSLSPDNRSQSSDHTEYGLPTTPNYTGHSRDHYGPPSTLPATNHAPKMQHDYRGPSMPYQGATLGRPYQPPPPPPTEGTNDTMHLTSADYSLSAAQVMESYGNSRAPPPSPTPLIPSAQTVFAPPPWGTVLPMSHAVPMTMTTSHISPARPAYGLLTAPTPPGPPPPSPGRTHSASLKQPIEEPPVTDSRSDLLAAIRMGIQLKKVQEQQELQAKREPVGNDVATILSRRVAVEYSDSDDSELEDNEWSD